MATGVHFNSAIWWPHLDMGNPVQDKTMESVDIVGYGDCVLQVGYNQRDVLALTAPYNVIADTLDGTPVPLTLTAPTMSYRLIYPGWDPGNEDTDSQRFWEFNAMGVNVT